MYRRADIDEVNVGAAIGREVGCYSYSCPWTGN